MIGSRIIQRMNQRNDDFVEGNIGIDTNSKIEEKIIFDYQKQQQRQYRGTSTSPSLLFRSSTAFPLSSTNKGVVGPTTTASKKRYSSTSDDEPPSTRLTSRTSSLSSSTAVRTLETSSVTNASSADTSSRRRNGLCLVRWSCPCCEIGDHTLFVIPMGTRTIFRHDNDLTRLKFFQTNNTSAPPRRHSWSELVE